MTKIVNILLTKKIGGKNDTFLLSEKKKRFN
jgi:hypothetical protein